MMNKIIHDLINTGEVVSFINNVIVETKKEEGHNKVVKEIIKRLVKNDLNSYAQASKNQCWRCHLYQGHIFN